MTDTASGALKVQGGRRLRQTLRAAGVDLGQMKEAHGRIARIVGIAARFGAPEISGKLKLSLRWSGTNTASIIRAGFARLPYAGPVHWGWPAKNIKANPWIANAAQDTESTWFGAYVGDVENVIGQIQGA